MSAARATRVLQRMRDIFGHRFDEAVPVITGFIIEDWQMAIEDASDDQLEQFFDYCADKSWPPTASDAEEFFYE